MLEHIPEIVALLIPIVAIIMGIGIGMLAIYLDYRKRREMFSLYHQERMAAIEKGIELPPLPDEFFAQQRKHPPSPHSKLLGGLVLSFSGLALFLALLVGGEGADSVYALVIVAVGLALLIFYSKVDKKRIEADSGKTTDAPRSTPAA